MIEFAAMVFAGLLGSFHCIGMCGPIAISMGRQDAGWRWNVLRQSVFTTGRLFTYGVMGVAGGFTGSRLDQSVGVWVNVSAILAIVAGCLLCLQGLLLLGLFPRKKGAKQGCWGVSFLAPFLTSPRVRNVFLGGLFTGMLPCGLVYGALALASSSQDPLRAGLLMVIFGLGTAPMMMLTGSVGSVLVANMRRRVLQVAAWAVVAAGTVSIARGFGFLHFPGVIDAPGCPLCP